MMVTPTPLPTQGLFELENRTYQHDCKPRSSTWIRLSKPLTADQHSSAFRPEVDVEETKKSIILSVEIPGVPKEDVSIKISNDRILTIAGEKKLRQFKAAKIIGERQFGRFNRTFRLRENLDENGITAQFNSGVLTVTIQKRVDKIKEVTIE